MSCLSHLKYSFIVVPVYARAAKIGTRFDVRAGTMADLILEPNVIVYGLDRDLVEHIASETAAHLAYRRQGEVITET